MTSPRHPPAPPGPDLLHLERQLPGSERERAGHHGIGRVRRRSRHRWTRSCRHLLPALAELVGRWLGRVLAGCSRGWCADRRADVSLRAAGHPRRADRGHRCRVQLPERRERWLPGS
ncbi:hypothetical protein QJS66_07120 [Kocuria rhizophila]|nr:hypothetical protein QJS66_07120 [Kocuria rhizophila]